MDPAALWCNHARRAVRTCFGTSAGWSAFEPQPADACTCQSFGMLLAFRSWYSEYEAFEVHQRIEGSRLPWAFSQWTVSVHDWTWIWCCILVRGDSWQKWCFSVSFCLAYDGMLHFVVCDSRVLLNLESLKIMAYMVLVGSDFRNISQ